VVKNATDVANWHQTTNNEQQTTSNRQLATNNKQRTTDNKQPERINNEWLKAKWSKAILGDLFGTSTAMNQ
jgi:hypothetical protein